MTTNIIKRFAMAALSAMAIFATASADTITEGFDNFSGKYNASWKWEVVMPEGWDFTGQANMFATGSDQYKSSKPSIEISDPNTSAYLITPRLEGEFSFWLRNYTKSYQASVTAYACTYDSGELKLGEEIGKKTLAKVNSPSWEKVTFSANAPTRVALLISTAYFDDFTYTPAVAKSQPSLSVTNYPNGSVYDFGTVPEGTLATFNLINQGTEELTITNISITGGFIINSGSDLESLEGGAAAEIVVATPAADASGALTIESSDPENPSYVINLTSVYKVPRPVMEVSPKSINFGKVTAEASASITVSNSGDALLEATLVSDNVAFEVAPVSISVAPGENAEVTVTYKYDSSSIGVNAAEITVTPSEGDAVVVEVFAKVPDPNVWVEDFEAEGLPVGWDADEDGWSIANGVAKGKYVYQKDYYLTTPPLKVVKGDELTFQYKSTAFFADIEIECSKDDGAFEPCCKISDLKGMLDFEEYTISGLEDGTYRFRFKNDGYELDNFEGLRLALKEHALSITSASIPAKAWQYGPCEASVSVRELMGREESAKAVLYVDGKDVAEATHEFAPGENFTFNLTFTPLVASAEGVEAYVKITYAEEESVVSDVVNLVVEKAPVWDEADGFVDSDIDTTIPYVVFNYTVRQGWNSISVPFTLTPDRMEEIFGSNWEIFELKKFSNGVITFQYPQQVVAGYPYVVYCREQESETPEYDVLAADDAEDAPAGIVLRDVKIERSTPGSDVINGVEFHGSYAAVKADGTHHVVDSGNLVKAEEGTVIPGFRGYLLLPDTVTEMPRLEFLDGNGVPTGVSVVGAEAEALKGIFDLRGVPAREPLAPGIYVIDGKKIMIK